MPYPKRSDESDSTSIYGDTKHGFQPSDHAGWLKLDGRLLSTLTTSQQFQASQLGINTNLPNAFGRVVMGADAVSIFPPKSMGGSANIQRSELPNVTLTGTVDQRNTAHTHDTNDTDPERAANAVRVAKELWDKCYTPAA